MVAIVALTKLRWSDVVFKKLSQNSGFHKLPVFAFETLLSFHKFELYNDVFRVDRVILVCSFLVGSSFQLK